MTLRVLALLINAVLLAQSQQPQPQKVTQKVWWGRSGLGKRV